MKKYNVYAVPTSRGIDNGEGIELISQDLNEKDADAIVTMCVIRRGVGFHFYTDVEVDSENDKLYKELMIDN